MNIISKKCWQKNERCTNVCNIFMLCLFVFIRLLCFGLSPLAQSCAARHAPSLGDGLLKPRLVLHVPVFRVPVCVFSNFPVGLRAGFSRWLLWLWLWLLRGI